MIERRNAGLQAGCVKCGMPATFTDAGKMLWCEMHEYRGKLFNWGAHHGYPDLHCLHYAIGPGAYCWGTAVLLGDDDFIGLMADYVETADEQEEEVA